MVTCLDIEPSSSGAAVRPRRGMSTTRPLLGMRRVTELTCPEQPSSRVPASAAKLQLDATTVDEFAVLEDKEEELKCAKPRVEQVFKVTFTIIGLLDHTGQPHGSKTSRQIWLQLRGNREEVSKAKVRSHSTVSLIYDASTVRRDPVLLYSKISSNDNIQAPTLLLLLPSSCLCSR